MAYELVVTEPFGYQGNVYQKGDVISLGAIADVAERDHPNKTVRRPVEATEPPPEGDPE
jgi:hypothetical protein